MSFRDYTIFRGGGGGGGGFGLDKGGFGSDPRDPYGRYRTGAAGFYNPQGGSSGSFSDFLSSLPTPEQTTPLSPYISGRRGETGVGPNLVPAIWSAYAPHAANLINRGADARSQSLISGTSAGRMDFERDLLDSYSSGGLDQFFARKQFAETRPEAGMQLQAGLGQVENQRLDEMFGLQTGLTNAFAESNASERQMALEAFLASKGRRQARNSAKSAQTSQLIGAGVGAAGRFLGGPAFGVMMAGGAAAGTA